MKTRPLERNQFVRLKQICWGRFTRSQMWKKAGRSGLRFSELSKRGTIPNLQTTRPRFKHDILTATATSSNTLTNAICTLKQKIVECSYTGIPCPEIRNAAFELSRVNVSIQNLQTGFDLQNTKGILLIPERYILGNIKDPGNFARNPDGSTARRPEGMDKCCAIPHLSK
jgi:hypothetical protein